MADPSPNPSPAPRLAPVTPATDALFVYGTLRFPRILTALLGRAPAGTPATVTGWRTAALKNRPYPGLVRAENGGAEDLRANVRAEDVRARGDRAKRDRARGDRAKGGGMGAGDSGVGAHGLLLRGLSAREWRILDDFEDDAYELCALPLDIAPHEAWAYIWAAPDQVRADTWEAEVFAARQLDAYAERLESAGS